MMGSLILFPGIRQGDEEYVEACIACAVPFKDGDMVHSDESGGCIHAACCGPEPESYVDEDGRALRPIDDIPDPWMWMERP